MIVGAYIIFNHAFNSRFEFYSKSDAEDWLKKEGYERTRIENEWVRVDEFPFFTYETYATIHDLEA